MDTLRLDKFLFQARFFKTRALAAKLVADGRVRLDGKPVAKAHQPVRPGDVLTFPQGNAIRVVRVMALPTRRGPATEARGCYEDLSPPATARAEAAASLLT
jgi:ribosome-associated heat shock protein Hsp15